MPPSAYKNRVGAAEHIAQRPVKITNVSRLNRPARMLTSERFDDGVATIPASVRLPSDGSRRDRTCSCLLTCSLLPVLIGAPFVVRLF